MGNTIVSFGNSMIRPVRKRLRRLSKAYRRLRRRSRNRVSRFSLSFQRRLEDIRYRRRWHSPSIVRTAVSTSKQLPRPDFIIIGAPKCGTSWLQGALNQHPDILMVPDEIEYFSAHEDFPLEWYLHYFEQRIAAAPPRSASYIVGEKSARYCSLTPERIRRVRRLLPDAQLILMARDPIARHWAQAKRYFSKKRFDKQGGGVLSLPRDELFDFFVRMRRLSEFSQMIANWTAVFPSRHLLIVSQERTLAAPRATFDAVLDHIGLSRDYDPAQINLLVARKNRGPSIPMPDDVAEFLEGMFAAERNRLRDLLGDSAAVYV